MAVYTELGLAVASLLIVATTLLLFYARRRGSGERRPPSRLRAAFSLGPLGLRGRGAKTHAITNVSEFGTAEEWAKSLASRSCRSTLLKQVPKAATAWQLNITSIHPREMGPEHLGVILAHEERVLGGVASCKASLKSNARFAVARGMVGIIDEYRDGASGVLLAWCHCIVRGNTLRSMWFYSDNAAAAKLAASENVHMSSANGNIANGSATSQLSASAAQGAAGGACSGSASRSSSAKDPRCSEFIDMIVYFILWYD